MDRNDTSSSSWLNVIAGIWLIIAPFVLSYTSATARTNDIILGIIVGILALIRALVPGRNIFWLSWVNLILGIWLIIAPFVLNYSGVTARYNDVILGIIVGVISLWSVYAHNPATGGHHAHA